MKQTTIKNIIKVSGKGIHTGSFTNVLIKPSKSNSGISFIRVDLPNKPKIKATLKNINSTRRSTNLKYQEAEIKTVEHLLAAIKGANIDNADVEVDNIEIPILDGSAQEFSNLLSKAGISKLSEEKKIFEITEEIQFKPPDSESSFVVVPSNKYELHVKIDYNSKVLGIQTASLSSINKFKEDISSSRTFCFLHELEYLLENNLIKGGEIGNAIVIVENSITKKKLEFLKKIFKNKNLCETKSGILNNLKLRFSNEPARHKLLDLVGDLALISRQIKGKIYAIKPGHKNNIKFAKYLENLINKKNEA